MDTKTIKVSWSKRLIGQVVTIEGWVETIRAQKTMQFLVVRDSTGKVQVAHQRVTDVELATIIDGLTPESTIQVTGIVTSNAQVKLGGIEIVPTSIVVTSLAVKPLPIFSDTNQDQRLDWRYLDLRRPEIRLIFEIQTTIEMAMREYWTSQGFIEIHSPKLMAQASESGGELFHVDYFEGHAYLAQSPQFYKQMGMAAGFDRVFEIGPVFRANPSSTPRHDTEFTSVDMEISWITSHQDVMAFEEAWIQHFVKAIEKSHGAIINDLYKTKVEIPTLPFPQITMAEAEAIVTRAGHTLAEKGDLDPEGERIVSRFIKETYGHDFVFVTDYPAKVRAFYHMRYPDRPDITKSFDLLYRGVEITTGAQREHRYDVLHKQVLEKGLTPELLQSYLDFFKYGCPPHGGLGFGLTRFLKQLLGLSSVREATYVFRGPTRLTP